LQRRGQRKTSRSNFRTLLDVGRIPCGQQVGNPFGCRSRNSFCDLLPIRLVALRDRAALGLILPQTRTADR
jgi:hypothetical protein